MSFLSSIKPLLRGSSTVAVTISQSDNGMNLLIQPKLEKHDPDTSDEALAALQAALAHPVRITIPADADPDAALAAALSRVNEHRAPVQDDLETYLDSLVQAQQEAKAAAEKKAATKGTKKVAKPTKSTQDDATTSEAAPTPDPAPAPATPAEASPSTPAAAPVANLFD